MSAARSAEFPLRILQALSTLEYQATNILGYTAQFTWSLAANHQFGLSAARPPQDIVCISLKQILILF